MVSVPCVCEHTGLGRRPQEEPSGGLVHPGLFLSSLGASLCVFRAESVVSPPVTDWALDVLHGAGLSVCKGPMRTAALLVGWLEPLTLTLAGNAAGGTGESSPGS